LGQKNAWAGQEPTGINFASGEMRGDSPQRLHIVVTGLLRTFYSNSSWPTLRSQLMLDSEEAQAIDCGLMWLL